jgi:hypothetical protein
MKEEGMGSNFSEDVGEKRAKYIFPKTNGIRALSE